MSKAKQCEDCGNVLLGVNDTNGEPPRYINGSDILAIVHCKCKPIGKASSLHVIIEPGKVWRSATQQEMNEEYDKGGKI